jgi:hypothetical protein
MNETSLELLCNRLLLIFFLSENIGNGSYREVTFYQARKDILLNQLT